MKKLSAVLAFVTVATLSLPQHASAQFGFRGGMNLSKFVGGDATSDSEARPQLGASIPLLSLGPISIVPEIYYAQRGGQRQLQNATVEGVANPLADFSMNYIEVPLLLRLGVALPGPFSAYVAGGPSFAWQLDCDVSFQSAAAQSLGQEQDCKETQFSGSRTAMESADRAAVGNAGVNLAVGALGAVNLDLRLVRGLARLNDDASDPAVKSQGVSLMLGYSFLTGGIR